MDKRHKGYVVAGDERSDGKRIWKVRVKDSQSLFNGKKLIVASVHDNIELSKGLNVDFLVGSVDGSNGEKIDRAVDVSLQKGQTSIESKGKKENFMKKVLLTILMAMAFTYIFSGCEKKPTEKVAEPNKVTAVEPSVTKPEVIRPDRQGPEFARERGPGGRARFDPASMLQRLDPNDLEKLKKDFPNLDFNEPNAVREDPNAMNAVRELMRTRGPSGFIPGGFGEVRPEIGEPNKPVDVNDPLEKINLKDVKMEVILEKLAQWTGKVIHPAAELMALKITVLSPKEIPRSQALKEIYFALEEKGYTHLEQNERIILKQSSDAKFEKIPVILPEQSLSELKDETQRVQKFFRLKSYNASQMATFIQPLIDSSGHIGADVASGTLIVTDTVGNLIKLEKIIQQLDIPGSGADIVIDILPLEYGDPEKIVRLLNQLLGTESTIGLTRQRTSSDRFREGFGGGFRSSESQPTPQPQVTVAEAKTTPTTQKAPSTGVTAISIPATKGTIVLIPNLERRQIIVRASSADMEIIREWIKKLDVKEDIEESQWETITLKYASPTEVESAIDNNVREMPAEIRPTISIDALEAQKQVVITGSITAREYVKKLIEKIDIPIPPLPKKTWQLNYIDIGELETHLQKIYQVTDTSVSRTRGFMPFGFRETAVSETIYVSTFPSRREITIRASESTLKQIDELINSLDQPMKWEPPVIIELRNTDPIEMVELMDYIFGSEFTTRTTTTRSFMQMMFGGGETTQKVVGKWYGKVIFREVPGAKKIIMIATNPEAYDEIVPWIEDLDKAEPAELPEMVTLKYADPEDLSERLNALFNQPGTAARIRRTERGIEYTIQQEETTTTTTGQQQTTTTTEYTPPWSGSGARTTVETEMPISNLIGQIRFIPDPRTKSILILAPSEYIEGIVSKINELDKPGKQVMIEAIIVEVDQSKLVNVGTQFASDPTAFGGLNENSIRALFEPTQQESHGSMTFGAAGTSGSAFKLNVGADINVLVDFLVKYTNAKVINKQSIYTKDNANAEFFKGEEIAFESASTVTTGGTVTRSYDYKEIGITLRVRPNITPEKNVDMIIDLALSQLSQDLVNTQPRTPRTRNTSTMIVKDGQTIKLGSIVTQKDSNIQRKVPLLGDIPILGEAFRHRNSLQSNNELLVFITPYVVDEEINPEKVIPDFGSSINKLEKISGELAERWLEKVE